MLQNGVYIMLSIGLAPSTETTKDKFGGIFEKIAFERF